MGFHKKRAIRVSVIRAFIAVDLTPEIYQRLEQVSAQIRQRLGEAPVRWAPVENIHLTLKFLGDVSLANLEMLKKLLQAEVAGHRIFEISVGGMGSFPTIHRPRVVWVGVEAPPELGSLQFGIETEMERLGYAREDRPFSAHLTMGRVSRNATSQEVRKIGEALDSIKVGFLGVAQIRDVYLYKSDLKPEGAIYTRIFTTPLHE